MRDDFPLWTLDSTTLDQSRKYAVLGVVYEDITLSPIALESIYAVLDGNINERLRFNGISLPMASFWIASARSSSVQCVEE